MRSGLIVTSIRPEDERQPDSNSPLSTPVGVALSGGGYRASLLAVGALIALIDRGLNRQVEIISSVSGGSITNAVVAQAGDYRALGPGDLDACATKLVRALLRHSVIALKSTLWVVVIIPLLFFPLVLFNDSAAERLLGVAVGIVVAALQLSLYGRTVRQGLTAQFDLNETLGDVAKHTTTIHTFCSTDLVTGMPLTFSSPGRVRRRVSGGKEGDRELIVEQPRWRLAAVVQASAAFPGIPPMRVKFPELAGAPSRWALCADGGIWNNLGTQGIGDQPHLPEMSVLCVNASARAKPMRPGWCFVPGIGVAAAVARSVNILNLNTVAPRIEAIDRDVLLWAQNSAAAVQSLPPTIVADMRSVADSVDLLRALPVDVGVDDLVATPWWIALPLTTARMTSERRQNSPRSARRRRARWCFVGTPTHGWHR